MFVKKVGFIMGTGVVTAYMSADDIAEHDEELQARHDATFVRVWLPTVLSDAEYAKVAKLNVRLLRAMYPLLSVHGPRAHGLRVALAGLLSRMETAGQVDATVNRFIFYGGFPRIPSKVRVQAMLNGRQAARINWQLGEDAVFPAHLTKLGDIGIIKQRYNVTPFPEDFLACLNMFCLTELLFDILVEDDFGRQHGTWLQRHVTLREELLTTGR